MQSFSQYQWFLTLSMYTVRCRPVWALMQANPNRSTPLFIQLPSLGRSSSQKHLGNKTWYTGEELRVCCVCLQLTFKEDEPAVVSLVGSIYVSRQTPPEVTDGHGVIIQNPVLTHPPEPTALRGTKLRSVCSYCQLNTASKTQYFLYSSVFQNSWLRLKAYKSKVKQCPNKFKTYVFMSHFNSIPLPFQNIPVHDKCTYRIGRMYSFCKNKIHFSLVNWVSLFAPLRSDSTVIMLDGHYVKQTELCRITRPERTIN